MTRIEQPHHSIRWRRGEPSIEWGNAQALARPSSHRRARSAGASPRPPSAYCTVSHVTRQERLPHCTPPPSQQQARGFRPRVHLRLRRDHLPTTTYNVTVPADDPGGYEPGKRGNAARRRRTRPRTSGVSPLSGLLCGLVASVPRGCVDGCAGVRLRGAHRYAGRGGADRSPNRIRPTCHLSV